MATPVILLSLIVFLPALGAIGLAFIPRKNEDAIRYVTLVVTAAVFALTVFVFLVPGQAGFGMKFETLEPAAAYMQSVFNWSWIPSFNIYYFMGVDGISFPLIMLTALVSLLAMAASWSVTKYVKAYCILFLLLETGMLGVFFALDFFLFYVFWEVMLLPMYFLIGVWGGPRREYAAIKFFLYTLVGSVLMLIAILLLYFNSDLRALTEPYGTDFTTAQWQQLSLHENVVARLEQGDDAPIHTFNLLALAALGQHTDVFSTNLQWWSFLLLFVGFIIKVPSVPLHTWLPDAHVEAPTPISMILAGILLKMGGYGIIRICYPICPHGGFDLAVFVCMVGLVSMVYGAFAALAQRDFKRLVAYSSVSHMGYVVLGMGVWSALARSNFNPDYWNLGVQGAMFQMIAHGISSAGMFFMVGVVYDRVHHRNLNEFGALFGKMPVYTALSIGIFFAALGLPGLCGFIGEVFVVLSVWKYSEWMAIVSASVVILTAAYILWTIQRVYLGPQYKGPHEEALTPISVREGTVAGVLFVLAILLGVFPYQTVLNYMDPTISRQVDELATWTKEVKTPMLLAADNENRQDPSQNEQAGAQAADQAGQAAVADEGQLQPRRQVAAGKQAVNSKVAVRAGP